MILQSEGFHQKVEVIFSSGGTSRPGADWKTRGATPNSKRYLPRSAQCLEIAGTRVPGLIARLYKSDFLESWENVGST